MRLNTVKNFLVPLTSVLALAVIVFGLVGAPKLDSKSLSAVLIYPNAIESRPLFQYRKGAGAAYFFRKNKPVSIDVTSSGTVKYLSLECVARYPLNIGAKNTPLKIFPKSTTLIGSQYSTSFAFPALNSLIWPKCSLISIRPYNSDVTWRMAQLWQNSTASAVVVGSATKLPLEVRPFLGKQPHRCGRYFDRKFVTK